MGVPEVEAPEDADTEVIDGPSLAEAAASPEQDDAAAIDAEESTEVAPADEPEEAENAASAWTDEQLLGAGWTQEQIDAMRNG